MKIAIIIIFLLLLQFKFFKPKNLAYPVLDFFQNEMEEVLAFLNNQRKDIKETQQNLYPGLIYFTYFYKVSALLKKKVQ